MGSAQSARRIQPGGVSPAVPVVSRRIFPAPRSSRPLHPRVVSSPRVPPLRRRARGVAGARGRGRGWGRRGTAPRPATGRRRAHFHRGGAPRPAPGRLGRPGLGKVARGGRRHPWAPSHPAPSVTAPRQQRSPNPGAEEAGYPSPRSPPLPALHLPCGGVYSSPARGARRCLSGGPGRPSHGATALPPPPSRSRGPGAGRTVPSAPRASSRRRARGVVSGHAPARAKPSARGRRRCRPPTRPVLKHGPRSLTRARVRGSHESRRGAMKVKGPVRGPEVGSRGFSSPPRAHHRPVSPAPPGRWSTSARVRTRKMVNYAWAGRSQRKLWWRSVAVLTCKSVVRPGYRGERLIEPSSSWFPPKFPSG